MTAFHARAAVHNGRAQAWVLFVEHTRGGSAGDSARNGDEGC